MIKLGQKVRDKITGFEGVAIGKTIWLNGCTRIGIQGVKLKEDGTMTDTQWVDEPQLEVIKEFTKPSKEETGGPRGEPKRKTDPTR